MKTNEKKLSLIGYGLKPSLVMSLNESQINHLHVRLVKQRKTVKEQTLNIPKTDMVSINKAKSEKKPFITYEEEIREDEVNEKSVSKKQQEFFGVVRSMQKGKTPKKGKAGEAAKEMSKKDVKDFASTKHKGLPKKVETKEGGYMDMIGKASNKNMGNKIADIKPSLKWESILEDEFSQIIENSIFPKMTKKDFIRTIMESPEVLPEPGTKPAPTITPKPDFDPFDDPDPSDDPEAKSDGFRFFMGQVKKNRMIK